MLLIVLVVCALAGLLFIRGERVRPLSTAERLWLADRRLEDERRRTRRAMNDAAGQSWRNIID